MLLYAFPYFLLEQCCFFAYVHVCFSFCLSLCGFVCSVRFSLSFLRNTCYLIWQRFAVQSSFDSHGGAPICCIRNFPPIGMAPKHFPQCSIREKTREEGFATDQKMLWVISARRCNSHKIFLHCLRAFGSFCFKLRSSRYLFDEAQSS